MIDHRRKIVVGIAGLILSRLPDAEFDKTTPEAWPSHLPPGMIGTPERVLRAFEEMTSGYSIKADELLKVEFDGGGYDEVVALAGIPFHSLCEHHLLPFHGTADVAYLPINGVVVGVSKLARLVEAHARRFQIQERMTRDIASDLERVLTPSGVAVVVRAQHACMEARGIGKAATMTTSDMRGIYRTSPAARAEVLALFK